MSPSEPLTEKEFSLSRTVLVVGNGPVARLLIQELVDMDHPVVQVHPHGSVTGNHALGSGTHGPEPDESNHLTDPSRDDPIKDLGQAEIQDLGGFPGRFQVRLRLEQGGHVAEEVGAVILATDCRWLPCFHKWGLLPSDRVLSLSDLEKALASQTHHLPLDSDSPGTCVFLSGFVHHAHPLSQRRTVEAALKLMSASGIRTICLMDHFKVAETGMERLMLRAREAGVLFAKITGTRPEFVTNGGAYRVTYYDETLRRLVSVQPELLVLEEEVAPATETAQLAHVLGIHLDPGGFFQGDNIYNLPIFTNRTGIWVVGSAKGPVSAHEAFEEAKAAALEVSKLLASGTHEIGERRIELDTKKCTICLTCYRLCPHRAISYLNRRPVFYDLACRQCGICAAECPMHAIQVSGFTDRALREQIEDSAPPSGKDSPGESPLITAFCCQNSALEAATLASRTGVVLPQGLNMVPVPCAGKVDTDHLFRAFLAGADGVMVLACHHESCKSVTGSRLAQWRVESLYEALEEAGLEKERLLFAGLAPGMATDFLQACREMDARLSSLGTTPFKVHGSSKTAA